MVLLDGAAIFLTADTIINDPHFRGNSIPPVASVPPLLLLPALATLVLGINLVRSVPWKLLLGASAAGCILLGAVFELLGSMSRP